MDGVREVDMDKVGGRGIKRVEMVDGHTYWTGIESG